jgi:endo-1,4-beta-xylanase
MNSYIYVVVNVLILAVTSCVLGQGLPAGGKVLVDPKDSVQQLRVGGIDAPRTTTVSDVDVTGQPFTKARRADVSEASPNDWESQFVLTVNQPIEVDDVLLLRVWARCEWSMTSQSPLGMMHELNAEPWTKSVTFQTSVGGEWQQIDIPFRSPISYQAGQSQIAIRLGSTRQRLDIGPVELINFGKGVKIEALPRTRISYEGRSPDAPWRKAADERIDKLRKADMKVRVVDAQDKPVAGAKVEVKMTRHAFPFGTAISSKNILGDSEDQVRYRTELKRLFNEVVVENDMKMPLLMWQGYDLPMKALDWLDANQLPVRGHNLVWPGKEWMPELVNKRAESDPESFRLMLNAHVSFAASYFKGRVVDWDVINEPYTNRLVEEKLGRQAYIEYFKLAHAADPKAKLYINDFAILETGNQLSTPHMEHYFETIKFLLDNKAPVQGIGIQGHFASNFSSPDVMLKILDRFGSFGLPIKITEFDINTTDRELQADFMRDFMTVCFSHPSLEGVLQWGFWRRAHWIPDAALFDSDWTLLPHGKVYEELVTKTWATNATLATDASGTAGVRAFKGDYQISVTVNGKESIVSAKLANDGDTLVVKIP